MNPHVEDVYESMPIEMKKWLEEKRAMGSWEACIEADCFTIRMLRAAWEEGRKHGH